MIVVNKSKYENKLKPSKILINIIKNIKIFNIAFCRMLENTSKQLNIAFKNSVSHKINTPCKW